jgi:putative transposase
LALSKLCGFDDIREFQKAHREWIEAELSGDIAGRDDRWSESLAVGSEGFVEQVKMELGFRAAQHRQVAMADGLYTLRAPVLPYGDHFDMENEPLRPNNTVPWQTNLETTEA